MVLLPVKVKAVLLSADVEELVVKAGVPLLDVSKMPTVA